MRPSEPFVPSPAPSSGTGRREVLIGSIIGLVVVGVAVGVYFAKKHKSSSPQPTALKQESASPAPASVSPAPAAGQTAPQAAQAVEQAFQTPSSPPASARVASAVAQATPTVQPVEQLPQALRSPPESDPVALASKPALETQPQPPAIPTRTKLRQIGMALNVYAANHAGKYPDALADLAPIFLKDDVLVDADSGKPFEYLGKGKDTTAPGTDAIAYSSAGSGLSQVLLKNGSVVLFTAERLARFLADAEKAATQAVPSSAAPALATASAPEIRAAAPTRSTPAPSAPAPAEVRWLDGVTMVADCMQVVRGANNSVKTRLRPQVFEQRYRAQRVKYSGIIDSIKKADGSVNFKSAGKWPENYHVQAKFSPDKSTLLDGLQKGQRLTVEGDLAGFALPVVDAGAVGLFGPSRIITLSQVTVLTE
jgi:hypothetical protein